MAKLHTAQLLHIHELVQDLITITHWFSSRLYGLRNYRKALNPACQNICDRDVNAAIVRRFGA